MIGLSSYAGVMEKSANSTEEQQPCTLVNSCSNKQESGKKQTPKPVGGFVLVHAGEEILIKFHKRSKLHFLFLSILNRNYLLFFFFLKYVSQPTYFCLLSLGAGYHSESKAKEYKHVCKRACQRVSHISSRFIAAAELIG